MSLVRPVPVPTIAALHDAYAAGLDPAALIAEVYRRIASSGDAGIFLSLVPEAKAIEASQALGPFDPADYDQLLKVDMAAAEASFPELFAPDSPPDFGWDDDGWDDADTVKDLVSSHAVVDVARLADPSVPLADVRVQAQG